MDRFRRAAPSLLSVNPNETNIGRAAAVEILRQISEHSHSGFSLESHDESTEVQVSNEVEMIQAQEIFQGSGDNYHHHVQAAEQLQSEAWEAFNRAFHAPEAEEYRRAGHELYERVLQERLRALYQRGDEQNSILESRLHA